ncbi:MAG: Ig domain-containing protein [Oscillospiraceae bacterium]|nr:Ig domain-containing protein [Oscillospiraceae bacterium]
MSKVICDVCGTTYPETASQCPICGCAKPETAKAVSTDGSVEGTGYTFVKGGRFSKSNVRKRNKDVKPLREMPKEQHPWEDEEDDAQQVTEQSNRGLVIALVLLLLAIAAVLAYIIINFFGLPSESGKQTEPSSTTASDTTGSDDSTEDTGNPEIPCTDIVITEDSADLKVGDYWLINATATPENTTDLFTYESSDPAIATVSDQGKVTVLVAGEVTITVRCGEVTKTVKVVCIEDTPVPPDEPVTPDVPDNADDWKLRSNDITFYREGESSNMFRGTTSLLLITFTSDDETIVTFEDGVATAVGEGTTKIHAEYNGRKFSCIIRCVFASDDATTGGDAPTVDNATVNISHTDVTVKVGESFNLTLKDAAGTPAVVTWKAAKEGICTITNNKITGASVGNTIISTEYEGQTYACIVYVKAS